MMVEVLHEPQSLRCMTASCRVTIKQAGPHTPHDCRLIVYLQVYVPNLQLPYHYANHPGTFAATNITAKPKTISVAGFSSGPLAILCLSSEVQIESGNSSQSVTSRSTIGDGAVRIVQMYTGVPLGRGNWKPQTTAFPL